jgi:hypothetical protein
VSSRVPHFTAIDNSVLPRIPQAHQLPLNPPPPTLQRDDSTIPRGAGLFRHQGYYDILNLAGKTFFHDGWTAAREVTAPGLSSPPYQQIPVRLSHQNPVEKKNSSGKKINVKMVGRPTGFMCVQQRPIHVFLLLMPIDFQAHTSCQRCEPS